MRKAFFLLHFHTHTHPTGRVEKSKTCMNESESFRQEMRRGERERNIEEMSIGLN